MLEKGKRYTSQQLKDIYGPNYLEILNLVSKPFPFSPKSIITDFEEFDEETKSIYKALQTILKEKNPKQKIKVWATGSRVNGKWKTKEEAEIKAEIQGGKVKYSDYDFHTDAIIVPSKENLTNILGVVVDRAGEMTNRVLIPDN